MGGRYFITGSQLGILLLALKTGDGKIVDNAKKLIDKTMDDQFIGKKGDLDQLLIVGKDRIFHDHIKAHFEKEHPDAKVICKICGKTYDEILRNDRKKDKQKQMHRRA